VAGAPRRAATRTLPQTFAKTEVSTRHSRLRCGQTAPSSAGTSEAETRTRVGCDGSSLETLPYFRLRRCFTGRKPHARTGRVRRLRPRANPALHAFFDARQRHQCFIGTALQALCAGPPARTVQHAPPSKRGGSAETDVTRARGDTFRASKRSKRVYELLAPGRPSDEHQRGPVQQEGVPIADGLCTMPPPNVVPMNVSMWGTTGGCWRRGCASKSKLVPVVMLARCSATAKACSLVVQGHHDIVVYVDGLGQPPTWESGAISSKTDGRGNVAACELLLP